MKELTSILLVLVLLVSCDSEFEKSKIDKQPKSDITYIIPGQTATIPGGIESLYTYISQNIKYPKTAKEAGVEGRVFIEFVVDKTGEMTEYKILRGIGSGCDEEAFRVLTQYPDKWFPAKHEGEIVKQKIVLPISFHLGIK